MVTRSESLKIPSLIDDRMTGVILPVDAGATVAAGSEVPKEAATHPQT